ncbi:putative nucleotidyltransferase [Candidatus Desulfarcum epimagneticum]|uniref:Putative nucleotidyltransferase n=1 Tax=uncultured Desulfobacteraceae bacterium TaxID=218296 RepID=A0A484HL85_9BACT|nr:putative nucleotidyltransferase [uncultured Desulfobacteraceae bacterium]
MKNRLKKEDILNLLKTYKDENYERYKILKMGVFGSLAREEKKPDDVDIVLHLQEQDLFLMIGIKQDLEDILLMPVDIVSYRDQMNGFLKKRIDAEAVYV